MIIDIAQLPTIERALRTGVSTAQCWADDPDGELQAYALHIALHARRPDPTVASLAYVAVRHSDHSRYTRIVACSPHADAQRILAGDQS
jgi:hypothetical protein